MNTRKNAFFTFCLACIPGAGQMYVGYLKRGLSLMGVGCGLCAVAMIFRAEVLLVTLPGLFAYSFFDTWRLRNQQQGQCEADDYLWHIQPGSDAVVKGFVEKRHKLVGWGCILLAAVLLYNNILMPAVWRLSTMLQWGDWMYNALESVPQLVLIVLLMLLGVYLLRGPHDKAAQSGEEYVPYAAPVQPETPVPSQQAALTGAEAQHDHDE